MTDSEKKMKQYMAAVKRRLNLPSAVRKRVMSDFASSIEARREAGMTEEAILAELGSPSRAAADLNEQMKEYTYHKSPWRFLFALSAVLGGAELVGSAIAWLLYMATSDPYFAVGEAASVGIIGGADGPTAIFVTGPNWASYILPVVMLVVGILGFYRLSRCRQK